MRKLIGTLHLWLGMMSGLVIVILGITGCLYAFIDEIRPLVYYYRIFINPTKQQKMLPLQELKNNADVALKKKLPLLDVEIYADDRHTIVFRYRERNNQANLYTLIISSATSRFI
ncbi:PepSY domain-containing protein [Pedobacter sp. WC2423]|uniref:PepSY domain-containing protein n=1 Tax=Pedobacter sp. WC2423 TaxID=3234142 RepID=UPI0034671164